MSPFTPKNFLIGSALAARLKPVLIASTNTRSLDRATHWDCPRSVGGAGMKPLGWSTTCLGPTDPMCSHTVADPGPPLKQTSADAWRPPDRQACKRRRTSRHRSSVAALDGQASRGGRVVQQFAVDRDLVMGHDWRHLRHVVVLFASAFFAGLLARSALGLWRGGVAVRVLLVSVSRRGGGLRLFFLCVRAGSGALVDQIAGRRR